MTPYFSHDRDMGSEAKEQMVPTEEILLLSEIVESDVHQPEMPGTLEPRMYEYRIIMAALEHSSSSGPAHLALNGPA